MFGKDFNVTGDWMHVHIDVQSKKMEYQENERSGNVQFDEHPVQKLRMWTNNRRQKHFECFKLKYRYKI